MEEEKIRQGPNIYLYYWTIPVFFGLIALNYFTKTFRPDALDLNLMISIVSFLFGFLITIAFSMLLSKTATLKESLATETGRLVSLYLLSKKLGKEFHEKIKERIDRYTILTLKDYTSYEKSREEFYGFYEDVDYAQTRTKISESALASFLDVLAEFEPLREKLEYLTNRRIEWSIKFANYVLGIVLIVLLFLNRGDTFTNVLFIILSTVIIFIFLIIEDYDDLRIGDYTYNISNSEQIFDLIEKPRYYPGEVIGRARLIAGREYRVGLINKKTGEEKIVSLTYNPEFMSRLNTLLKKFDSKLD